MNARLSQDDAAALDLLLDRSAASGQTGPVYVPSQAQDHQRVQSAQRVLGLLHFMPVIDPPLDLLSRTLSHVSSATNTQLRTASLVPQSAQPHA